MTFCLAKFNQTFAEIRKRHTLCNSFVDILERRFKVESLVILILTRLPVFKKKVPVQQYSSEACIVWGTFWISASIWSDIKLIWLIRTASSYQSLYLHKHQWQNKGAQRWNKNRQRLCPLMRQIHADRDHGNVKRFVLLLLVIKVHVFLYHKVTQRNKEKVFPKLTF